MDDKDEGIKIPSPREGASTSGTDTKKKPSQADRMIALALLGDIRLFTDQRREPYIRLWRGEVYVTLRLRSREVKAWLAGLLWKDEEKAPSNEALQSALNVLEAMAREEAEIPLYNRVALDDLGGIYIDMADEGWRAIHVTREGWDVSDVVPVFFRRYSHQKALPYPVRGGPESIRRLLDFAHIEDEGERLLYLVAVVSAFIPDIPHVILVFHGPQGSGKTWSLRAARSVIDPSILDVLTLPRRQNELIQNLDHHYCAFYDNVGRIAPWISNVLCRAVTGTGVSKRQLYTDDEDVIREFLRNVGLTDISVAAERGDLLDRSLLLGLAFIPARLRKTEKELRASLEELRPEILGAILDILVKAMTLYPGVEVPGLFRMADFTKWGIAITEAMGEDPEHFIEAYRENIAKQGLEAIRASVVADVLIPYMGTQLDKSWSGTASQLWSALNEMAEAMKISTRQKAWPKNPQVLSRRLNELAPSLPAAGYEITSERTGTSRLIIIDCVNSVIASQPNDASDAYDAFFTVRTGVKDDGTSRTLQERLKDAEALGVRLVEENDGEPIEEADYCSALGRALGLKGEETQRVLEILLKEGRAFRPRPDALIFVGRAVDVEPSPTDGTGGTPGAEEEGVEDGSEEDVGAATGAPSPPEPFEAVMGIWTGLERDGEDTALLEGLAELLVRSGFSDPYGLIAETSSPEWWAQEGWRVELVGAELRSLGEEGECAICQRQGPLYADVENIWPVCLRCRLGQPATKSGLPWRFRVVTR